MPSIYRTSLCICPFWRIIRVEEHLKMLQRWFLSIHCCALKKKKKKRNSRQFWIESICKSSNTNTFYGVSKSDGGLLVWNTVIKLNNELNSKARFSLCRSPKCNAALTAANQANKQTSPTHRPITSHLSSIFTVPLSMGMSFFFSPFLFLWAIFYSSYTSV